MVFDAICNTDRYLSEKFPDQFFYMPCSIFQNPKTYHTNNCLSILVLNSVGKEYLKPHEKFIY